MIRATLAVWLALAASLAQAQAVEMTPAQRAALGRELRAYLLDHPEIIAEALQGAEARRQAAHAAGDIALLQAHAQALFHDPGDWTGGAASGDLTLVSFVDFRDPASQRALGAARDLVTRDGALRWVVKAAPATGDPAAMRAARFALAVREIGGDRACPRARTALFEAPDMMQTTLDAIARRLGLDPAAVTARMVAPEITARLERTRALMQALDLGPAPAHVLDRAMVRGDVPAVALARIADALRRKK